MFKMIYVTCPDMAVAKSLAGGLLQQRLIACANIIDGMVSLYHWEGELEESHEVVLLCKTVQEHVEAVTSYVCAQHPYEIPCIVVLPIEGGHGEFLAWIKKEVQKD